MNSHNPIELITESALLDCLDVPAGETHLQRRMAVLRLKLLVSKLRDAEQKLHDTFDPEFEKVVHSKNILAWGTLLEQEGYTIWVLSTS